MSVKLLMLAALHEAPREKSFLVAGTETVNMHGKLQTVPFVHHLLNPEKLTEIGARPGDALYIEASVTPVDGQPGRVLIFPRFVQMLGQQGVEKDEHGKFVRVGGFNHLLVGGTLKAAPTVENFAFGQKATHLTLSTDTRGGELAVVTYGLLAEALSKVPEGHYVNLQGRLAYDSRKDPLGRDIFTAHMEVARTDAMPPRKPRKDNKQKKEAATPNAAPQRQQGNTTPATPEGKTQDAAPGTPAANPAAQAKTPNKKTRKTTADMPQQESSQPQGSRKETANAAKDESPSEQPERQTFEGSNSPTPMSSPEQSVLGTAGEEAATASSAAVPATDAPATTPAPSTNPETTTAAASTSPASVDEIAALNPS